MDLISNLNPPNRQHHLWMGPKTRQQHLFKDFCCWSLGGKLQYSATRLDAKRLQRPCCHLIFATYFSTKWQRYLTLVSGFTHCAPSWILLLHSAITTTYISEVQTESSWMDDVCSSSIYLFSSSWCGLHETIRKKGTYHHQLISNVACPGLRILKIILSLKIQFVTWKQDGQFFGIFGS